jgi:Tol biopolymer transport system component
LFLAGAALPVFDRREQPTDLYIDPRPVDISGYAGCAMEPFLSPDGKFLFFNTSDESKSKTMRFAARTGPDSFRYLGELPGVNRHSGDAVDAAVPSLDATGRFFFTSTRQYGEDRHSIFAGDFDGAAVTHVHPVEGDMSDPGQSGRINMDVGVSPDGNTLYISRTRFSLLGLLFHDPPAASDLLIAHRAGDRFDLDPRGPEILKTINAPALQYAPAISGDGLELYFTRASEGVGPRIMVAVRPAPDAPFAEPRRIAALTGFVEAPALSRDGQELFFHK